MRTLSNVSAAVCDDNRVVSRIWQRRDGGNSLLVDCSQIGARAIANPDNVTDRIADSVQKSRNLGNSLVRPSDIEPKRPAITVVDFNPSYMVVQLISFLVIARACAR